MPVMSRERTAALAAMACGILLLCDVLVPSQRCDRKHREVFAFHQPDAERGLTSRFPCHARLGVHALGQVDQLHQVAALVRIGDRAFRGLEDFGVLAQIGGVARARSGSAPPGS
jgi:hypothetical protein